MGSVLKLPCTRFVRQVSNGVAMSKYGYNGMMQKNAEAIKSASWRKAACSPDEVALTVNKVTETDGVWNSEVGTWDKKPTFSVFCRDNYDCFKQGGDAVKELGTFCGYLGMVAYRFTLPVVNPGAIEELRLMIQRDRYLRSGVRVAIEINSTAMPSDDWNVIRGENPELYATASTKSSALGATSWGFLGQSEVPWLLASRALDDTLVVSADEFAGLAGAATGKYLWLYMSIEDMSDYWDMYSANEERFYSIEGSASLVASCCEFAFATDAVAPESVGDAVGDDLFVEDLVEPIEIARKLDEFGNFGMYCGLVGAMLDLPADDVRSSAALMNMLNGTAEDDLGICASDLDKADVSIKYSISGRFGLVGPASLHPNNTPCVFIAGRKRQTSHPGYTTKDGEIYIKNPLRMILGYQILPIPATVLDFKEYELIFSGRSSEVVNELKFGLPGLKFNLWLSSSRDFMGPWANVAGAALAKNGAMFTAAADRIEGSIRGTGELTKHITISASAKLVKSFSFEELLPVGKSTALLKCEDAKPGDTLILAPNISLVRPEPLSGENGECVACWYYAPSTSKHSAPVYLKDAPLMTWRAHAVRGRIQA